MGLAIGIGACMIIFLYVQNELTYDLYNLKVDRIARVTTTLHTPRIQCGIGYQSSAIGECAKERLP
ncbi:MAG: ABC transporter permease [Puia sp.]